jgi:hypothetical protein
MWLLTHAYSSMTQEQKDKLAALGAESRSYVLKARMRRLQEQVGVYKGLKPSGRLQCKACFGCSCLPCAGLLRD